MRMHARTRVYIYIFLTVTALTSRVLITAGVWRDTDVPQLTYKIAVTYMSCPTNGFTNPSYCQQQQWVRYSIHTLYCHTDHVNFLYYYSSCCLFVLLHTLADLLCPRHS